MVLYYKDTFSIVLHEDSYEVFRIDGEPAIYCVNEIEEWIRQEGNQ